MSMCKERKTKKSLRLPMKPIVVTCPYLRKAFNSLHPDKHLTVEIRKAYKSSGEGTHVVEFYEPRRLSWGFIWSETVQGFAFWNEIVDLAIQLRDGQQ